MAKERIYVCVLSTDNYLDGILLLNENLKDVNAKYELLCIINENISKKTIKTLEDFNIKWKKIKGIVYQGGIGHWKHSFDKLNIFTLLDYEKIVYLDSDLLILENIDELFDYNPPAICLDKPWYDDKFNSGVMVLKPLKHDFEVLTSLLKKKKYNGDQDVLNEFYQSNFNVLDAKYNVMRALEKDDESHGMIPVTKYNDIEPHNCKIIHYIRAFKPFMTDKPYKANDYFLYRKYLDRINLKKKAIEHNKKTTT